MQLNKAYKIEQPNKFCLIQQTSSRAQCRVLPRATWRV